MKKIISMLCAATLFASVLMGCGGGGKEEASSDAAILLEKTHQQKKAKAQMGLK